MACLLVRMWHKMLKDRRARKSRQDEEKYEARRSSLIRESLAARDARLESEMRQAYLAQYPSHRPYQF
ncbi:hypothetical protein LTR95_016751 [Oleoguttula sp. CCFEE 5521]